MSELALQIIEKEKREKTGTLNIGRCGLTEIPDIITEIDGLKSLIIGNSYHIKTNNDLVNNKNRHRMNQINNLEAISKLPGLQHLYCSEMNITDLAPLANSQNLETLVCSSTLISDLSPLEKLYKLQELTFARTSVSNLNPLASLKKLKTLVCSGTLVVDLMPLRNLPSLQRLFIANTQVFDISPLAHLSELTTIYCGGSLVSDLSPLIEKLRNGTKIMWADHIVDHRINIQNCPLICPPIEFALEGHDAVTEYFDQLEKGGENLNELKIIFLGEGAAGKTSLIRRLRKQEFNPKENQTHGIRIRKTPFEIEAETIEAHLWDFGGQEVMHATHQFFLSQRCIYVLVLNSRTDDKAEYWLKHAASFGGKSPVLVVLNKIDENPAFEVNRKVLSEKYPQIKGYYRLSCQTDQGLVEFEQALREQIAQADTRRTPFPTTWLAVKQHFSSMSKDYIESDEYRAVCLQKGVDQAFSQNVLLQFLHDLGVIINFRNLKNFDTQILNPLWITNGVYRIINSELIAKNKGLLHEQDFNAVINDPRYTEGNTTEKTFYYPSNKLHYIVRVMQEFELCFPLEHKLLCYPPTTPCRRT